MSDGNRLLKFVTKNGEPASSDLVQNLLPQIRKEAHKLPKGVITLTVDAQQVPPGPSKTASSNRVASVSMLTTMWRWGISATATTPDSGERSGESEQEAVHSIGQFLSFN